MVSAKGISKAISLSPFSNEELVLEWNNMKAKSKCQSLDLQSILKMGDGSLKKRLMMEFEIWVKDIYYSYSEMP